MLTQIKPREHVPCTFVVQCDIVEVLKIYSSKQMIIPVNIEIEVVTSLSVP